MSQEIPIVRKFHRKKNKIMPVQYTDNGHSENGFYLVPANPPDNVVYEVNDANLRMVPFNNEEQFDNQIALVKSTSFYEGDFVLEEVKNKKLPKILMKVDMQNTDKEKSILENELIKTQQLLLKELINQKTNKKDDEIIQKQALVIQPPPADVKLQLFEDKYVKEKCCSEVRI